MLRALTDWIDSFPVWAVVAAAFAVGSLVGVALRIARKGKWEEKERLEAAKEAKRAANSAGATSP
ncbi:MAG: hypothetical protein EXS13_11945 [Planctomycetes bacterium]|nr:hypothetical protein [Planctomycetota bacterium]